MLMIDRYLKAVLTVIVYLSVSGCVSMSTAELEALEETYQKEKDKQVSDYQKPYKRYEVVELCLEYDEQDEIVKYADYGRGRAKLKIIAISKELNARGLDPLLCRNQPN